MRAVAVSAEVQHQPAQSSEGLNSLVYRVHDLLGRHEEVMRHVLERVHGADPDEEPVDIRATTGTSALPTGTATSLTTRMGAAGIGTGAAAMLPCPARILSVVYSILGTSVTGATLTLGDRIIPIQVGASIAMPASFALSDPGIILQPEDTILLVPIGAAAQMYLELSGHLMKPGKNYRIIR